MDESTGRRLPVYLVLDTSGSMAGDPIEAVRMGVRALTSDLKTDPMAQETAYLSVITFSSSAQQVCPLTDVMSFQEPSLTASGSTALGHALEVLDEAIEREVRKSTSTQKGDWRPLVFLITDGQPTDQWHAGADRIKKRRVGAFIALAAGAGADDSVLKQITETVVRTSDLAPEKLKQFFKWASSSIKTTSTNVAAGRDAAAGLPPPPPNLTVVP